MKNVIILFIFISFLPSICNAKYEKTIKRVFNHKKVKINDLRLIQTIIKFESNGKINAVSNKQAIGLMQVKKSTSLFMQKLYNIKRKINLKSAYDNILIGVLYIQYLKNRWGNSLFLVLAAYNAGETPLKYWLVTYFPDNSDYKYWVRYKETRDYITKIKEYYYA